MVDAGVGYVMKTFTPLKSVGMMTVYNVTHALVLVMKQNTVVIRFLP